MFPIKRNLLITFDENVLNKTFEVLRENNIKFSAKMLSVWDLGLIDYCGVFDKAYSDNIDASYEKDKRNLMRYTIYVSIFDYKRASALVEEALGINKK
ncbi:MAG: hypothetical protein MJ245_06455 [Clostridia bacterium]|nr:hypothetical protein [Clostridia bacterium]